MKVPFWALAAVLLASALVACSGDSTAESGPGYTTRRLPGDNRPQGDFQPYVPPEKAAPVAKGPKVGDKAPEISGIDTDGVEFKLSDYQGKVVMLDFWGDW